MERFTRAIRRSCGDGDIEGKVRARVADTRDCKSGSFKAKEVACADLDVDHDQELRPA